MSRITDTIKILGDSGSHIITAKSATIDYSAIPVSLSATYSDIQTATAQIFPIRGDFLKDAKGEIANSTHMVYWPYTSTVAVGHRMFDTGDDNYYEVLEDRSYEDHHEFLVKKVENRE